MANDLNQINLIGRAGKDCELRTMPNGKPVASFSIAVGRSWKDANGERREDTTWINIIVFGPLAEHVAAKYVTKGKQLLVSGRLQIRKYQDRDGADKYSTEVIANQIQLLGSRDDPQQNNQTQQQYSNQGGQPAQNQPPANNTNGVQGQGLGDNNQPGPRERQYQQQTNQDDPPAFDPDGQIPF